MIPVMREKEANETIPNKKKVFTCALSDISITGNTITRLMPIIIKQYPKKSLKPIFL